MSDVPVPKLRRLLLKFYQENDPVILQQGFDINGLVEFTSEKGVDVVNRMLQKKYGKTIDVNGDTGDAKQNFNRMSQALTASTYIVGKEQEYREKLFKYFGKHDPSMVTPARHDQFEKFIKFAMLNGLEKLSEKLKAKYGEGVDMSQAKTAAKQEAIDVDDGQFGNNGLNPFHLDINRLRVDLQDFYQEMEDEEQLEVLDETTDWACQIGIDEFNKKLEQLYGTNLNNFLEGLGRKIHENKVTKVTAPQPPPEPVRQVPAIPTPAPVEVNAKEEVEYDIVEEEIEEPAPIREFNDMEDVEIVAELRAFYEKYDPDNIANISQVLELSRRIGRDQLNGHLQQIYDDVLKPVPSRIIRVVQKKVARAAKPKPKATERALPPVTVEAVKAPPPGLPAARQIPEFTEISSPPPPTFKQTFQAAPLPGMVVDKDDFKNSLANAVGNPNLRTQAPPPPKQTYYYEEEKPLTEFQKRQQKMKERIDAGKAIVTIGKGETMEVNILIDVCKNYVLEPLGGVCKTCGFAKSDHAWHERKGKRRA